MITERTSHENNYSPCAKPRRKTSRARVEFGTRVQETESETTLEKLSVALAPVCTEEDPQMISAQ